MMPYFLVSLISLGILNSSAAFCQEAAEELAQLKQQNELLEAKLEAATLKIEKLEKELAELKAKGRARSDDQKGERARTLADVLTEEAVLPGDWKNNVTASSGKWTLVVSERDGDRFKGRLSIQAERDHNSKPVPPNEQDLGTYEVEGKIAANSISFNTVNTAKVQARVAGRLVKDLLTLDYQTASGTRSTLKAVVK